MLACALIAGCGYQLATHATLPGGGAELQLLAPDVAAIDHPMLAPRLASALTTALGARGISVTSRAGVPQLRLVVHSLVLDDVVVRGRQSAGEAWQIAVEGHLRDRAGQTAWRSGLVTVRLSGPLPAGLGVAQASRARSRAALCRRAAERIVTAMLAR
jgi:hypothetical protein